MFDVQDGTKALDVFGDNDVIFEGKYIINVYGESFPFSVSYHI